ncbi:MAG: hypothetical protein IT285_02615 [Bdellovibrionales bacterium]|nr:hypothetical protein [Bdellovibrionales bacterium]
MRVVLGLRIALSLASLALGSAAEAIPRLAPTHPLRGLPLLVTHASRLFEEEGRTAPGLDAWVADFKARGETVVFLLSDADEGDAGWLGADLQPSYAIPSRSGEHELEMRTHQMAIAGGYWSLCMSGTVGDAAAAAFPHIPKAARGPSRGRRVFEVHAYLPAVYEDPHALRHPGQEMSIIPELQELGREAPLDEYLRVLGPRAFARSLKSVTQTALGSAAEHLVLELDGERQWSFRGTGQKDRELRLRLWSRLASWN